MADSVAHAKVASHAAEELIANATLINDRWVIVRHICSGATGAVYEAKDVHEGALRVAIKIAHDNRKVGGKSCGAIVYVEGARMADPPFAALNIAPRVIASGSYGVTRTFYVMELMGDDMIARFLHAPAAPHEAAAYNAAAVRCTAAVIRKLRAAYSIGLLHRDIKPDNVCFGRGVNKDTVYLVDWGVSQTRADCMRPKSVIGTAIYVSHWIETGATGCYLMDDLVSAAYTLLMILKRGLPWNDGPADRNRVLLKLELATCAAAYMKVCFPDNAALQAAFVMILGADTHRVVESDAFLDGVLRNLDAAAELFDSRAPPTGIVMPLSLSDAAGSDHEPPPPSAKRARTVPGGDARSYEKPYHRAR